MTFEDQKWGHYRISKPEWLKGGGGVGSDPDGHDEPPPPPPPN